MFLDSKSTFYVVVILSASFLLCGMMTAPIVSKIYAEPDTKFFKKENIKIQYDKKYKDKHHKYKDRCYDKHNHKYYKDHDKHNHKYYKDHGKHNHKYYKDHKNYKHDREYHKY